MSGVRGERTLVDGVTTRWEGSPLNERARQEVATGVAKSSDFQAVRPHTVVRTWPMNSKPKQIAEGDYISKATSHS